MVVEGSRRTHAALLTLLPTTLRDGEGGAAGPTGGHTGTILHGGRTGDGYNSTEREREREREQY